MSLQQGLIACIPGDIMFRKLFYELLAEKGYQAGFLPYVSNQYAEEA